MRQVAIALSALALGACQFLPGSEAQRFAEAEKDVRDRMSDPEAVQFRDIRACSRTPEAITGSFNAKNSFGAYVGFNEFFIIPGSGLILSDSQFYENAAKVCYGS